MYAINNKICVIKETGGSFYNKYVELDKTNFQLRFCLKIKEKSVLNDAS